MAVAIKKEHELFLTRTFDASPDVVFKAWTDPTVLTQWWGPKGYTNPVCEVDPQPGGAIRIHMRAPDGTTYPMTGVYESIVEPTLRTRAARTGSRNRQTPRRRHRR